MKSKSILISGASIAGLTAAYWLDRYGYHVTVVELAEGLRTGGWPVGLRPDAKEVLRKMEILETLEDRGLKPGKTSFYNGLGRHYRTITPKHDDSAMTLEVFRDDLIRTIYDATSKRVIYLFGQRIMNIFQHEDKVDTVLTNGEKRTYDFVIGADGIHSGVRKLVFGEESSFSCFLEMYSCVFDLRSHNSMDSNYARIYNTAGKLAYVFSHNNRSIALLVFRSQLPVNYDHRDTDQIKNILIESFERKDWNIASVLEALRETRSLYFGSVSQIKMPSWSKGRVALVGDAAYCPSFLAGSGANLALLGATTLVQEFMRADGNHLTAFQKYEESFRDTVTNTQSNIDFDKGFLIPKTKSAIWARNQFISAIPVLLYLKKTTKTVLSKIKQ